MSSVVLFERALKRYSTKTIGPIDLIVERGEVMGLIGPNGSGKTTTIRLMLGLIKPSAGRVLLNGFSPFSKRVEALRGVGYSPELPNLPTFFTPRELLMLIAREIGLSAQNHEVEDALERVGLLEYSDTKISKLSKGMVQRLSVAQALLGNPHTLVLDEPLIGVDPIGADHLRALISDFASKGGTVVLSSHQLSEVESVCTSVTAFRKGRVLFSGKVSELVKSFLGVRTIKVDALGVNKSILERVSALEGVLHIEEDKSSLRIRVQADRDVRAKIARLLIEEGCELREIRYLDNALDELYRRAVLGEGGLES
ncbi:hypothetical protein B9Q11_00235 [Candidatus Marsarchaeota G2 archaeon ECH_B_SAG-F08]|uniref:ABC transporter domain-containing protein n=2 Tax=Candidatus Marsarchaeota group 2 TaxID=2203771 RepID=A0A2R6BNM4_9ARCH|nr:MAG: hypothetical protein B9Q11_00235 [Candidatus Marsarchaeota G2 archaeon ECH_B_SAG-F08]PSO02264.1 MAG: hypothetical protein B9Q10_01530 [Candidatus Marsarchaeota G2 archaeon ECH_B_SAG-E12]